MFECEGKPYRVDFAAMARAMRRAGPDDHRRPRARPGAREALAASVPTVIQVPMENAPTPTPGYWNINDIYRKGS